LDYSSINNPRLEGKLDPDKYKESKAYIVRKYVSDTEGPVMIVSEYDKTRRTKREKLRSK
jgi:hypothetical protein